MVTRSPRSSPATLAIRRGLPAHFLGTAFQEADWVAVFLKQHESGRTCQRVGPLTAALHPRFQAWLLAMNVQRFNIYVSINAITPGHRARTRDAIGIVRHVFLDADEDGPAVLSRIAGRQDLPEPSYVVRSSPGRVHVLWRVTGFEAGRAEALQKLLARQLGTDPVATTSTQLTRLPGFFNHKYASPHLVTVDYRQTDRTLTPEAFLSVAPHDLPESLEAPTRRCFSRQNLPALERARCYLSQIPPAVAGQHGDVHTFQVCCRLARGFALAEDDGLAVLRDWNARCQPPWREAELRLKLRGALRYGREPIGGLL